MSTAKHKRPIDSEARFRLQCRYALRGLSEHRCPECGKRFDPADPQTTAATQRRGFADLAPETTPATLTMILAVGAALVLYQTTAFSSPSRTFLHPISQAFFWTALAVLLYGACSDRRLFGWPTRIGFICAVSLLAVMLLSEMLLFQVYLQLLLPLGCFSGLAGASIVHAMRARSLHPIAIFLMTFALVAWLYIVLVLVVTLFHFNANPFDYWTYWFWTPQRW